MVTAKRYALSPRCRCSRHALREKATRYALRSHENQPAQQQQRDFMKIKNRLRRRLIRG
jgi:hypothetical protein